MTHLPIEAALQRLRDHIDGAVSRDVPLAPYTAYRIGGPTAIWVAPAGETAHVRHLRLERPLVARVDGLAGLGVLELNGAPDRPTTSKGTAHE